MNLDHILKQLYEREITPEQAAKKLKHFTMEDIGVAHIDHHRAMRQGFPEVVYCEGKTEADAVAIIKKLAATGHPVLATRASREVYAKIKRSYKSAVYHERSRAIVIEKPGGKKVGAVLVLSAGTSDAAVAEEAAVTAEVMGSNVEMVHDVGVAGIHRLFAHAEKLKNARALVVVAGMDGALASVVGGLVDKPVIAVPTSVGYGASFGGVAALLSMLNSCSAGVAVMNIDNGFGAGALAHKINALAENAG